MIIRVISIVSMLLAVNINFVACSRFLGDAYGQVFVFFILTVAASEAAIGLAILVALFRNRRTINVAELDSLKGSGHDDSLGIRALENAKAVRKGRQGRKEQRVKNSFCELCVLCGNRKSLVKGKTVLVRLNSRDGRQ